MAGLGETEGVIGKEERHDAPPAARQITKHFDHALRYDEDRLGVGPFAVHNSAWRDLDDGRDVGNLCPLVGGQ